jgi:RNA polymerase sigma factor (TIGR02999 family)
MSEATAILDAMRKGNAEAPAAFLDLVYNELRRLAAGKLANEASGQTLQATALVHEAWLRLIGDQNRRFENRTHFFAAAAEAMRRILIERARRRHAVRHGGEYERVQLLDEMLGSPGDDEQLLALNDSLEKFELKHPVQAQVVKLRYFAGMTNEEIAALIGVSLSTVKNYWVFSKAWLYREIRGE